MFISDRQRPDVNLEGCGAFGSRDKFIDSVLQIIWPAFKLTVFHETISWFIAI